MNVFLITHNDIENVYNIATWKNECEFTIGNKIIHVYGKKKLFRSYKKHTLLDFAFKR